MYSWALGDNSENGGDLFRYPVVHATAWLQVRLPVARARSRCSFNTGAYAVRWCVGSCIITHDFISRSIHPSSFRFFQKIWYTFYSNECTHESMSHNRQKHADYMPPVVGDCIHDGNGSFLRRCVDCDAVKRIHLLYCQWRCCHSLLLSKHWAVVQQLPSHLHINTISHPLRCVWHPAVPRKLKSVVSTFFENSPYLIDFIWFYFIWLIWYDLIWFDLIWSVYLVKR